MNTGHVAAPDAPPATLMQRLLDAIERVGNRAPHPVMIFVYLILGVVVLSHLLHAFGLGVTYQVIDPETDELLTRTALANSLLTLDGIRFMFTGVVQNLMSFNAVGVIIVAMLGVGIAEESGLVKALIKKLVAAAPPAALTYILAFVGIVSSVAADAGYLVLIPLAAAAYHRPPSAGGPGAWLRPGRLGLSGQRHDRADGCDPDGDHQRHHPPAEPQPVHRPGANLWFSMGSVALLVLLIGLVNDRVVEPRLGIYAGERPDAAEGALSPAESRDLRFALYAC